MNTKEEPVISRDRSGNRGEVSESVKAVAELEQSIALALEMYANVHRGSGHFSKVSTHLYEKAREIVLEFLELQPRSYELLFMSPRRALTFSRVLLPGSYKTISSKEYGLALGVVAVAVRRKSLPLGTPFETGGGTTKLYGPDWVIWAGEPDRFEAGTPAIINVIAFARALQLMKQYGPDLFNSIAGLEITPSELLRSGEEFTLNGMELLQKLRETMMGRETMVPATSGLKRFINFDNAASTPAFRPVWETFRHSLWLNAPSREKMIDEVREICSETFGAPLKDFDVIFTSNTTESINITASGLGMPTEMEPVILTTLLEHSSNDLPWRTVSGHSLLRLATDNEGVFNLRELEDLMRGYNQEGLHGKKRIRLVTVSGASNVLGTCNNLAAVSSIVHSYGAKLMVDAAQLAAHREIAMEDTGIDGLAFSAHKVYAPFGTGVLIIRKGLLSYPETEWQLIRASGEENTGGIAALGKSLLLLKRIGFDLIETEENKLTNKVLKELSMIPAVNIHGMKTASKEGGTTKTGVIGFSVNSFMPATIARGLALSGGIGVRFGCLCSHLIIKQISGFTPFQEKFQRFVVKLVPILNLQGVIRVSFGIQNTEAEVDAFLLELRRIVCADNNGKSGHPQGGTVLEKKVVKQQIKDFIISGEHLVFG